MEAMEGQMEFIRKLPTPKELKEEYPISPEVEARKLARDREIEDILTGRSRKLLLVIGPCSADREDAVLDYMHRLARVQEEVADGMLQDGVGRSTAGQGKSVC